MAVRFIIGRAGTGKTAHCFRSIVDAMRADPLGPPIHLLLPKQATFAAERELTCNSGLPGFCRARVISFDQLSRDILAECGGGAIPEVTPLGRQMLLGHLLRRHRGELKFFAAVAEQPGLAAKLDSAFAEFQRCGKNAAELLTIVQELQSIEGNDAESRVLLDKLRDFHLLYNAYTEFLGQDRLDPHGRLAQMLACMEQSMAFRGASVYVDGFAEFTENERRTLVQLAKVAAHIDIALLLDPGSPTVRDVNILPHELDLFHHTEQTYRLLHFAFTGERITLAEPLMLREPKRFAEPSLSHVERFGFAKKPAAMEGRPDGVELIEAPDRRGEVDAAARRIREMLNDGARLRDIAVLVRDINAYHAMIDASFREHGLPYFVDRRRTATHHPLLQFTRAVLSIARQNWPNEAVMTLLKSGLAGVSLDDADELENYVLLHRIHGNAWMKSTPWTYHRSMSRRGGEDEMLPPERVEAARADAIRRPFVGKLQGFIGKLRSTETRSIRQTVTDLFQLFESFGVRKTLASWIDEAAAAGELEQRGEHEQVWAELIELIDQMVDLLGDEEVNIVSFSEILEAGLEQFDLALTPPTVDQILVGQVDRTRCPPLHAVIVLGLNEGQFPRAAHEDTILSDAERRTLSDRRLELEPDSNRKLLDESLLGYIAFTRASSRLIVTRPASDDAGRPQAASSLWHRLEKLFPNLSPRIIDRRQTDDVEAIGTPRQMIDRLVRWVREDSERPATGESSPWPALYQWLATHPCCDDEAMTDMVDTMRSRSWRALQYENNASLSPDVAQQLFAPPLHASVTRIETFATCPFKHFAQYGLKLRPREEQDVTAMDLGNVYHSILERVVREMLQSRRDWCELESTVTDAMIHDFAEEIGRELRGELMLSSARNKYLLQRIERTLSQVIAHQRAMTARGSFRPHAAELGFGIDDSELPAFKIVTPRGRELLLHGKIDRVDLVKDQAQFAVIDYKLSRNALALDRVYHGISLQLLTYLLVLQAGGEQVFGRKLTPAAAFYVRLLRGLENVKHPGDALEPDHRAFHLKEKPRGIFDAACFARLDPECDADGGPSEVVAAFLKKDGTFGRADANDSADSRAFAALLAHVHRKIGELGDQLIGGAIDIAPYRINRLTPCPHCDFRAVCRFDAGVNRYHTLPAMKKSAVLERVLEGRDHA
jgi:ATP-dependent helicase/nuclease subunit B